MCVCERRGLPAKQASFLFLGLKCYWRQLLRVVLDVLEQREGLPVEQQQELGQVGAPQGQAGLQHEHLGTTQDVH